MGFRTWDRIGRNYTKYHWAIWGYILYISRIYPGDFTAILEPMAKIQKTTAHFIPFIYWMKKSRIIALIIWFAKIILKKIKISITQILSKTALMIWAIFVAFWNSKQNISYYSYVITKLFIFMRALHCRFFDISGYIPQIARDMSPKLPGYILCKSLVSFKGQKDIFQNCMQDMQYIQYIYLLDFLVLFFLSLITQIIISCSQE